MTLQADTLRPGFVLGRYVLERKLGEGGAARVYLARHQALGTQHAVKVLLRPSGTMRERLLLEGRVQASLSHPNIVQVVDVDTFDGLPCLIMEFIDGPTLAEVLRIQPPGLEQVDRLGTQILSAVAYAHGRGLVHRDLKPENVLLATRDGEVVPKVADFGLVKVLGSDRSRTRTGSTMGTPLYMAPEQIRDAKNVDQRADIFSLGTILYTLLAHRNPFEDDDMFEVFQAIVHGKQVPIREACPEAPERMLRTIERAMQVDPDARFCHARGLLACWTGQEVPEATTDGVGCDPFVEATMRLSRSIPPAGDAEPTAFPEGDGGAVTLAPAEDQQTTTYDTQPAPVESPPPPATEERRPVPMGVLVAVGAVAIATFVGLSWMTRPEVPTAVPAVASPVVKPVVEPAPPSVPTEKPERVEAPSPAPVEVAPTPAPAPAPSPVVPQPGTEVEVPAPSPVAVEAPAPPVEPVPEPVEPVAPSAPITAFVNDATDVRVVLRGAAGNFGPGELPPGTYTVVGFFAGEPTNAGTAEITEGTTVHVRCRADLKLCTVR